MATWVDEYLMLVDDCEKRESRLTDWEAHFIDSIRRRLENEQVLSAKQIQTLENVLEKATSKG